MSTRGLCAYCGELFGSISAYDRHLLIRRETVITPKSHVVPNEEVITCRAVDDFTKPSPRTGQPRLVATTDAKGRRIWVERLRDRRQFAQEARKPAGVGSSA